MRSTVDTASAILEGGVRRGLAPIEMPVEDALKALVEASLLRRAGGSGGRPRRAGLDSVRPRCSGST